MGHYTQCNTLFLCHPKENFVLVSAVFDRCSMTDRNVGLYNISAGQLTVSKVDLTLLLNCERTMRKKSVRIYLPSTE